jgi:hypothetical protein
MNISENGLTEIDLSSSPALERLIICDNFLTEIDLSNNPLLNFFYINYNRLDDISSLANLQNLMYLDLSSNLLTDVSPLANLQNLVYLDLSGNSLTDISSLADLQDLNLVDVAGNYLDINSAANQASIEKIRETTDRNDGEFRYTPQSGFDEFTLTISADETTVVQGENFSVNVELKNISWRTQEISHIFLFRPEIPDWDLLRDDLGGIAIDPPMPQTRFLESDGVLRNINLFGYNGDEPWKIGHSLPPGTHELRFRADFTINGFPVQIYSNPITLTVLPTP